ncbi:MAG: hypothetical protein A2X36_15170 [Elusimicrobia bacterium GWA2_69_24]|nr:MAG: hypothetical protein A2X36_15170 [Elusimicrobia bacterium GWA2_69_24]HBL15986.1 hypothetical protein [Elusimicrobiota bacterium]
MKRMILAVVGAALSFCPEASLSALETQDPDLPWTVHRMESDYSDRIQARLMDPILGEGRSAVFVSMRLHVASNEATDYRGGSGAASKSKRRFVPMQRSSGTISDLDFVDEIDLCPTDGDVFKKTKPRGVNSAAGTKDADPANAKDISSQAQEAQQTKTVSASSATATSRPVDMDVRVVYDENLPAGRVDAARRAVLAAYGERLATEHIRFVPAPFLEKSRRGRQLK